jgi:hypothetical protein
MEGRHEYFQSKQDTYAIYCHISGPEATKIMWTGSTKTSILYTFPNVKHRCQADIIAAILGAAAGGEVPKSKIYYKSVLT